MYGQRNIEFRFFWTDVDVIFVLLITRTDDIRYNMRIVSMGKAF
jgi:hypothetical protein